MGSAYLAEAALAANQSLDFWTVYGPSLVETGAILITALVAILVAVRAIMNERAIARTSLAFDSFSRTLWDRDYLKARKKFIEIRNGGDLAKWSAAEHDASEEAEAIRSILNYYETMAIGIEGRILDEGFLFNAFRGALLRDWDTAEAFVAAMRKRLDNDQLFIKTQRLAKRWAGLKPGDL